MTDDNMRTNASFFRIDYYSIMIPRRTHEINSYKKELENLG
jgi:hypothetical protein